MSDVHTPPVGTPGRFATRYLKYILGFGVWFVIGLAPFLGKTRLPGFSAVIEMYPASLRDWLIPLSGIFMGMAAVIVQFAATHGLSKRKTMRSFKRAVVVFAVSFLLLPIVYTYAVVRLDRAVPDSSDFTTIAVITGAPNVPDPPTTEDCGCKARMSAARCLHEHISIKPANIADCFGWRVRAATMTLVLLYLGVTGSFAAAVGLLLIAEKNAVRSAA